VSKERSKQREPEIGEQQADIGFTWCEEHQVILEGWERLQAGDAMGARLVLERYLQKGGLCTETILLNLLNAYLDAPPARRTLEAFMDEVLEYTDRCHSVNLALAGNLALLLLRMKRFLHAAYVFEGMLDAGVDLPSEEQADYLFAALSSGEPGLCQRAAEYLELEVLPEQTDPGLIQELTIALVSLRRAAGKRGSNRQLRSPDPERAEAFLALQEV